MVFNGLIVMVYHFLVMMICPLRCYVVVTYLMLLVGNVGCILAMVIHADVLSVVRMYPGKSQMHPTATATVITDVVVTCIIIIIIDE